jgi:hypothetical protein
MPKASEDYRLVFNSIVNYDTFTAHPKLAGPAVDGLAAGRAHHSSSYNGNGPSTILAGTVTLK